MPGYYKRSDLTAQSIVDVWLHTGDLGYGDEDGFLYVVDRERERKKETHDHQRRHQVFPKDIEEVIVQHPAVREAAVFGIPSDRWTRHHWLG
jgi:long-chain acyl-CoA synthetase